MCLCPTDGCAIFKRSVIRREGGEEKRLLLYCRLTGLLLEMSRCVVAQCCFLTIFFLFVGKYTSATC